MSLSWGAVPVLVPAEDLETGRTPDAARRIARQLGLAADEGHLLMLRGFRDDPRKSRPSITVLAM